MHFPRSVHGAAGTHRLRTRRNGQLDRKFAGLRNTIELRDGSEVHLHELGSGPKNLVVILGFGYGTEQLNPLLRELKNDFTLYLIELPFHAGKWVKGFYVPADIKVIIESAVAKIKQEPIHLLGHSLGARAWLKTLPLLDFAPASLTLVAPDGLGGPYTVWLDRLPKFAVGIMSKLLDRPDGLLRISDFLRRHNLINAFSLRYLQHQLGDPFSQRRLGGTLRSLPHFKIGTRELNYLSNITTVTVFFGERDGIIDRERIQASFARLPNVKLIMTKGGHGLPLQKLVKHLRQIVS